MRAQNALPSLQDDDMLEIETPGYVLRTSRHHSSRAWHPDMDMMMLTGTGATTHCGHCCLTAVPESEPESSSVSVYFAPLTPMDAALMSDKYHNYSWHTTDQSGTRIKLIQPFFSVRLSFCRQQSAQCVLISCLGCSVAKSTCNLLVY